MDADRVPQPLERTNVVVPFRRSRIERIEPTDADRNAAWDRLVRLAVEAWTWRDPDSVAELRSVVSMLEAQIAREWSA